MANKTIESATEAHQLNKNVEQPKSKTSNIRLFYFFFFHCAVMKDSQLNNNPMWVTFCLPHFVFPLLFGFHTYAAFEWMRKVLTHLRGHAHSPQNNASNCENVRFALRSMQTKRNLLDVSEGMMISSQCIRVRGGGFLFRMPFSLG